MRHSELNINLQCQQRRAILKAGASAGLVFAFGAGGFSCCPNNSCSTGTNRVPHDWSMVAYCCLECDQCDAYIATQNNNAELKAKVAKEWEMKAEKISCDGCKSDNALFNCEAKKCAIDRKFPTCAHCPDFPSCDKEIWTKWPILKEKVEQMRIQLQS